MQKKKPEPSLSVDSATPILRQGPQILACPSCQSLSLVQQMAFVGLSLTTHSQCALPECQHEEAAFYGFCSKNLMGFVLPTG